MRKTVYLKYGWLGMNDSIELSHFFRLRRQCVELITIHWQSDFFLAKREFNGIVHCATICISHKQFLAKKFAAVESGQYSGEFASS